MEIIADLGVAGLPQAETFASNLVGLEGHGAVGSLDAPAARSATGSTLDDGIRIDAVAKRFRHFSSPGIHAQTVNPDVFERGSVKEKRALEHGVVQPRAHNLLPLRSQCGRETPLETVVVLEQAADEEVGIRGIHPRVEHLLLTNDVTEFRSEVVPGTEEGSVVPVKHAASGRWVFAPWLHVRSLWRNDDLRPRIGIPNWNLCVVPSAAGNRPIDGNVVHPIQQELTVTGRMELHLFDELLQAVLHVRLPDVPFLEQDDFNRVLAALRNGDLLILLDHVGDVPGRFQVLDGGRTGLEHRHAGERPSERGHATFKVDGLEGVQSQLPEDSDVVLVAKRADHQDT